MLSFFLLTIFIIDIKKYLERDADWIQSNEGYADDIVTNDLTLLLFKKS